MAVNNPFSGPDYPRWLAMRIGDKNTIFPPAPPGGGGQQISVRLKADRLDLIDVLSQKSGWNRNQIIEGMLDAGLAQVFAYLPDDVAEAVMDQTCSRVLERTGQSPTTGAASVSSLK